MNEAPPPNNFTSQESLTPDERSYVLIKVGSLLPVLEELGEYLPAFYEAYDGTPTENFIIGERAITLWGYIAPGGTKYEEFHVFASEAVIEEKGVLPHRLLSSEYWIIDNTGHPDNDFYMRSTRLTDQEGIDMHHRLKTGSFSTDEITLRILQRLVAVHNHHQTGSAHEHLRELAALLDQLGPHNRVNI
jgi:hypothetical protein